MCREAEERRAEAGAAAGPTASLLVRCRVRPASFLYMRGLVQGDPDVLRTL